MTDATFPHRACPACAADQPKVEVSSAHPAEAMSLDALRPAWMGLNDDKPFFSYARCGMCGLLYAPAFFTDAQLDELYADMAPNMDVVPLAAIERTQRGYFDTAAEGATLDGDFLELGPDIGYVAGHAAREGRFDRFWLVEPNRSVHPQLAAAVGDRPHAILTDLEDLSAVPDGSVGLAVMVHVLDHLLAPLATLTTLHRKLKPGGRLMIVTHNEASLLRRVMGRKWPPFCLQHPELYNPRSIAALARRAGYAATRVRRSRNYFPIDFMARQAAGTVGVRLDRLPLPKTALGLRLGNIITVAEK
ncbi:class I SAM-dependent methyltransferase [Sphingomonas sp.]|uniref:class I SAM-dependent methyltransferase n=1 Tax=Sphingomonas sp. TaxID=28214 RepID=UPI003CC6A12C